MIIALDYDDTFTADKELWTGFVERAKLNGHEVTFVTFRRDADHGAVREHQDIMDDAEALGINIVFTNGNQKKHYFKADVWIDDMPILLPTYEEMKGMIQGCENSGDIHVRC